MQMENVQGRCMTVTIALTDREKEISAHFCEGLADAEIAQMLNISVFTVRAHLGRIKAKHNCFGIGRVAFANLLKGDGQSAS